MRADPDINKLKYRVQPTDTGLVSAEVYALSEEDAIKIVENNKQYDYLFYHQDVILEAYDVTPTFEKLVEEFVKGMPMDGLPSKEYVEDFIIESKRIFKNESNR